MMKRNFIMSTSKKAKIKAEEFDRKFDSGEDVTAHLDKQTAKVRAGVQRVNIDIPQPMLQRLDQEADRIGIPRTALIKLWISERIDRLAS
jgi:hypothetical protein